MHAIWKYLIQDFLETGCRMSPEEMFPVLQAYEENSPSEKNLEVHPAFSLGEHMTIVLKHSGIRELWVYDPVQKKIEKVALKQSENCYR